MQKTLSDVSKAKLTSEVKEDEIGEGYELSDSVKRGKKKYKDVADAAQAAFESAAQAADAARAAVELSHFSPRGGEIHLVVLKTRKQNKNVMMMIFKKVKWM